MNRHRHAFTRPSVADMLASGLWLPPHAAADALGCTVRELLDHHRAGAIRRRAVAPGRFLYEVPGRQ